MSMNQPPAGAPENSSEAGGRDRISAQQQIGLADNVVRRLVTMADGKNGLARSVSRVAGALGDDRLEPAELELRRLMRNRDGDEEVRLPRELVDRIAKALRATAEQIGYYSNELAGSWTDIRDGVRQLSAELELEARR